MQALKNFEIEQAPLTGQLTFVADGAGSFDAPTWTIAGNIKTCTPAAKASARCARG
jgi:hypothetical protein